MPSASGSWLRAFERRTTSPSFTSRQPCFRVFLLLSDTLDVLRSQSIQRFHKRVHLLPERAAIGLPFVPRRAQGYRVAIAVGGNGVSNALHVKRDREAARIGADFGQGSHLGETRH